MSLEFLLRLIGMVLLSLAGVRLGINLSQIANEPPEVWALLMGSLGALFGLILTPYLTTHPVRRLRDWLSDLPVQQLLSGTAGLVVGLIVAALLSLPLGLLPQPYAALLPLAAAGGFGYLGVVVFTAHRRDLFSMMQGQLPSLSLGAASEEGLTPSRQVLLDTSVIIDGRIADISMTGFIMGAMLVPRFVLNELQHIADSSDPMRRTRGRRGIEVLNQMQKEALVPVKITDLDVEEVEPVDEKLIMLARRLRCAILTNDYNLNRIAELQGVVVLNINDLANAVKAIYLPGEDMTITVIQEGRELGQGVGYLDDGTMVVVEGGRRFVDDTINVTVTKVLQTSAGRMIFARPNNE